MKKTLVTLLLLSILSTNVISCGNSKTDKNQQKQETSKQESLDDAKSTENEKDVKQEDPNSTNADGNINELEGLGDIDVEKELFDVTITIPAEYVGEATQEELDAQASQYGYKITKNEDGSATYTMTKAQHKEMLRQTSESINSSLSEYIGSEDYPNITDVKANEDFTNFIITTKSTELDMGESFLSIALYTYGGMYHIFSGQEIDNIHIDFINADTGEIISSSDSSDLGQE